MRDGQRKWEIVRIGKRTQKHSGLNKVLRLVMLGLGVAAVVKELRQPADDRRWHGTVAGFVPYEFRRPTLARLRDRVWNPASKHLLAPQVFGVGWTLNMGRVFVGLKEMLTRDR